MPYIQHWKDKTIWCPCDKEDSEFVKVLKENGFNIVYSHIDYGQDFFAYTPRQFDVILTNPPYKNKKIEKVFNAGYDSFRCPTQAELARFHTYPVEIMQQFTAAQAQSLMGDGWHCGSIQWLFDKLKEIIGNKGDKNGNLCNCDI